MRVLKIVVWVVVVVVALPLAALAFLRMAGMPQSDGEIDAAVGAPLKIVRDANGIVHVLAASERDAHFALGFAHAQDRLWQMEMNRRIASGSLAQVLGPAALDTDRFLRTLGVRRNAERIVAAMDEPTRATLQAYADGVNAGIALTMASPWKLSPEFMLLGVRPQPWTPADSVGWSTMMAWDLAGNLQSELLRFALSEKLGNEQLTQLLDSDPKMPFANLKTFYKGLDRSGLAGLIGAMPPGAVEGTGSNNWVLDGTRSVTGKPLLANDPHLGLAAPALWYLAHLSAPGLDVVGGTLPGLPYVLLGRNARIAWGMTNTGPDTQDLFLERIDPADPGRYLTPTGSMPFEVRTETISVKGAPDVVLQVRQTRHGPVISPALAQAGEILRARGLQDRFVLAFSWTALTPDDTSARAVLRMNRARDWNEFLAATRDNVASQQNVVYADVDGNIGFVAPARIPIRKPGNDLHGMAPAPGWDARYDWAGFIPFDQLPRSFRPASGSIVTANQKIVGDDYPYFLSAEWVLPSRYERISKRLSERDRHDLASFTSIQADVVSMEMRQLLPVLRTARPGSEAGRAALERLRPWNGDMRADAPEPLIAVAVADQLRKRLFEDETGEALFPYVERQRSRSRVLVAALTDPAGVGWCDDVRTPVVENCQSVLDQAFDEAVQGLVVREGADLSAWRWGSAHAALSEHRPFGRVAALARIFDVRVPTGGGIDTVNVSRHNPRDAGDPFAGRHAASMRALYDLSGAPRAYLMQSTGQSGHALSPHYRDMAQRWAQVEFIEVTMERASIERDAYRTLVLRPSR